MKTRHLDELAVAHRFVLRGLALSFVTGVLLFTSDVETYFSAGIYWVKMTLVVLLLVNGYVMTRTERRIRGLPDSTAAWARLRLTAVASLVLWFTIALAGVALVNFS